MPAPFDALKKFKARFKQSTEYRAFESDDEARLRERLPATFIELLKQDGFANYDDGLLWSCDPDDWNKSCQPWRPNDRSIEVFMRTSFGDFFLWDGDYVWFAIINDAQVLYCIHDMDWFLGRFIVEKGFLPATGIPADTKKAIKMHGKLSWDECYFWNPALLLGGSKDDSTIEKGNFATTLSILGQLATPTIQAI